MGCPVKHTRIDKRTTGPICDCANAGGQVSMVHSSMLHILRYDEKGLLVESRQYLLKERPSLKRHEGWLDAAATAAPAVVGGTRGDAAARGLALQH